MNVNIALGRKLHEAAPFGVTAWGYNVSLESLAESAARNVRYYEDVMETLRKSHANLVRRGARMDFTTLAFNRRLIASTLRCLRGWREVLA